MAPARKGTKSTVQKRSSIQLQKQALNADFDKQVKLRVKEMKKDLEIALTKLDNIYAMHMVSISSEVKKMKIEDYWASGGNIAAALEKLDLNMEKELDEGIARTLDLKPPRQPRKKLNETVTDVPQSTRPIRTCRKKMQMETVTTVVTRVETEDTNGVIQMKYLPTKTPSTAFRLAIPGEVLYSIRGSPVLTKFVGERIAKNEKSMMLADDHSSKKCKK